MLVFFIGVTVFGCGTDERVPVLFGGPTAVDVVRSATITNIYRIEDTSKLHQNVTDYATTSGPVVIPAIDSAKLGVCF